MCIIRKSSLPLLGLLSSRVLTCSPYLRLLSQCLTSKESTPDQTLKITPHKPLAVSYAEIKSFSLCAHTEFRQYALAQILSSIQNFCLALHSNSGTPRTENGFPRGYLFSCLGCHRHDHPGYLSSGSAGYLSLRQTIAFS